MQSLKRNIWSMNSLISIIRVGTLAVVSGLTEEMSCKLDSCSQNGLYNFIGCVTIMRLSFLDMIQNIYDFYVVSYGHTTTFRFCKTEMNRTLRLCETASCPTIEPRPLNFAKRKTIVLDEWLFVCDFVVPGSWTTASELRETETNHARRMTMCNWLLRPVVGPRPLIFVRRRRTVLYDWLLVSARMNLSRRVRWL